jgi:hypothetical protein
MAGQVPAARIESQADLQKYLDAFNSRRYDEQICYYAPDVVFKVGTLTLMSPQAIAEFYADFHEYVKEHVAIAEYLQNGDTVALAVDSRFEAFRDYEKHGLSFKVGNPLRFVSLIFYKLQNGKIHRIRMGRYNGAPDDFYA